MPMLSRYLSVALTAGLLLGVGVDAGAGAQETIVWSDIDCSQSKLVVPAGLRCRETNEAGTRGRATSTGIGVTKRWNAFGTVDRVKLYYYVHEVLSPRTHISVGQMTEVLHGVSPEAKGASKMSEPTPRSGADFVTFVGAKQERCVGIRKLGPSTGTGIAWVLYATRCAPAGQRTSDSDIEAFVTTADFQR